MYISVHMQDKKVQTESIYEGSESGTCPHWERRHMQRARFSQFTMMIESAADIATFTRFCNVCIYAQTLTIIIFIDGNTTPKACQIQLHSAGENGRALTVRRQNYHFYSCIDVPVQICRTREKQPVESRYTRKILSFFSLR